MATTTSVSYRTCAISILIGVVHLCIAQSLRKNGTAKVYCHGNKCFIKVMTIFFPEKNDSLPSTTWQRNIGSGWETIQRDTGGFRFKGDYNVFNKHMKSVGRYCQATEEYCYIEDTLIINPANVSDLGRYSAIVRDSSKSSAVTFGDISLNEDVLRANGVIETQDTDTPNNNRGKVRTFNINIIYYVIGGVAGTITVISAFLCGKYFSIKEQHKTRHRNRNEDRVGSIAISSHLYDEIPSVSAGTRYDELNQDDVGKPNEYSRPHTENSPVYRDPAFSNTLLVPPTKYKRKYVKKDSLGYLQPESVVRNQTSQADNMLYADAVNVTSHKPLQPTYSNSCETKELLKTDTSKDPKHKPKYSKVNETKTPNKTGKKYCRDHVALEPTYSNSSEEADKLKNFNEKKQLIRQLSFGARPQPQTSYTNVDLQKM